MTEVLHAIGEDLRAAARRRAARRRRRRLSSLIGGLAVLTVATAAGAGDVDPLGLLPHADGPFAPPAEHVQRLDLTLDASAAAGGGAGADGGADAGGGTGATSARIVAYISRERMLCMTATVGGRRPQSVGCGAGFVAATDPQFADGLASLSFYAAGPGMRLIAGTVAGDVDAVTVRDARGGRHPAAVSERTLRLPVTIPSRGLTAEGRRLASTLPRAITLRSFAVLVPRLRRPAAIRRLPTARRRAAAWPAMRFELRHDDGSMRQAEGPPGSG